MKKIKLFDDDALIFGGGKYFRPVEKVCSGRREEVFSGIFWTEVVGIFLWFTRPEKIRGSKYTVMAGLYMRPSIPIPWSDPTLSRCDTRGLKYTSYWFPSAWSKIFECEIVALFI